MYGTVIFNGTVGHLTVPCIWLSVFHFWFIFKNPYKINHESVRVVSPIILNDVESTFIWETFLWISSKWKYVKVLDFQLKVFWSCSLRKFLVKLKKGDSTFKPWHVFKVLSKNIWNGEETNSLSNKIKLSIHCYT